MIFYWGFRLLLMLRPMSPVKHLHFNHTIRLFIFTHFSAKDNVMPFGE